MIELVYDKKNGLEVSEVALDIWIAEVVSRYQKYSTSPEYYLKVVVRTLPMVLAFLEVVRSGLIPHSSATLSSKVDGLMFLSVIMPNGEVHTLRIDSNNVAAILTKDDKLTVVNK